MFLKVGITKYDKLQEENNGLDEGHNPKCTKYEARAYETTPKQVKPMMAEGGEV